MYPANDLISKPKEKRLLRFTWPNAIKGNIASSAPRGGWIASLLVFQTVYLVSYIDRQILSTVVDPLKRDLQLSDSQIGFLQGFAFSLVLALSALLLARRVDIGNRTRLLGACVIVWCLATVSSGFARDFWMLLLARTGLAFSEAIVPVVVLSMLADIVPRRLLPRAGALFMAGPYIGGGLAWWLAGPMLMVLERWQGGSLPWLGEFQPWRGLFWLIGAPGVLLGVGILLWMKDPARRERTAIHRAPLEPVLPFLRRNATFLLTLMTFLSFLNVINMTIYGWTPTFMMRVHGMDAATAGAMVGPLCIIAGVLGSILGSWLMTGNDANHILTHVIRNMVRLMVMCALPLLLAPFVANRYVALALLLLGFLLLSAIMTSSLMPLQLFAPGAVRGRVTAICAIYSGGLGGVGPMVTGMLTDRVFSSPDALGLAMGICFMAAMAVASIAGPAALRQAQAIEDKPNEWV